MSLNPTNNFILAEELLEWARSRHEVNRERGPRSALRQRLRPDGRAG